MPQAESFEALTDTLKVAVAALRDAGVEFVLGGSLAAWVRGGAEEAAYVRDHKFAGFDLRGARKKNARSQRTGDRP